MNILKDDIFSFWQIKITHLLAKLTVSLSRQANDFLTRNLDNPKPKPTRQTILYQGRKSDIKIYKTLASHIYFSYLRLIKFFWVAPANAHRPT